MCGIAGQIDLEQTHNLASHREVYERMQRALVRRGPDQNGLWLTEDAALVHTRLSVVDSEGRPAAHDSAAGGAGVRLGL